MKRQHLQLAAAAAVLIVIGVAFGVPLSTLLLIGIVLACPLMMMFMHGGGHDGHRGSDQSGHEHGADTRPHRPDDSTRH